MSKTKHLDTALEIFKSDKARRAKGPLFTLNIVGDSGTLQGPRGKTVATFTGTPAEIEQAARQRVGTASTMAIYKS